MERQSCLSLLKWDGWGDTAGAEKATLGRLPAALTQREIGCCGKLEPTRAFGYPPVVTVLNKDPWSPPLSLGPTLPLGGAVEVWAEEMPCRVGV